MATNETTSDGDEHRAEAEKRAEYFERVHDLRKPVGMAAAYLQMGYSSSGVAGEMDTTAGTVRSYMDTLEERFGPLVCHARMPAERTGPLDAGDPDEYKLEDPSGVFEAAEEDGEREIPEDLLGEQRWICWVEVEDEARGKLTKKPRAPWSASEHDRGSHASIDPTDPTNWTTFDEAKKWADMTPHWGIGFSFTPGGEFVGIDLDDCRDPESGDVEPWAQEIIARAGAFAEVSPSGTGIHIYVRGSLDGSLKNEEEGVELYDRTRFFTVTGDRIDGAPMDVPERQDLVDNLMEEYMTESRPAGRGGSYDGGSGGDYDGEPFSPFDELLVSDVYPDLPIDENIEHPEHGSSTGQNFKIHAGDDERPEGATAICWHGQHQVGHKEGCGLSAHHLLAMRTVEESAPDCDVIRERWANDDELVFDAWVHTVTEEDHIDVDPSPPPWRALRYIADEHDISGLGDGGQDTRLAIRITSRIIRSQTGIDVDIDDD